MRSDYKLPLPVLRGYLGRPTLSEFESPHTEGTFHRAWRCGCIAQYRNSVHQTATWRPCATHRVQPNDSAESSTGPVVEPNGEGPERRSGTIFCIVDTELNVLCKSPGSEIEQLMGVVSDVIPRLIADGGSAVVPVNSTTVLRIMPLQGEPANAFAVVVEGHRGQSRRIEAATRYGLTRRETDVLRLLLDHKTSGQIAEELCIAESTVSDHLKSLYRKTNSKRRTELLTKLYFV